MNTQKINNRSDIINYLIDRNNYKRYLEIGVRDNKNFNRIKAEHKDGVDPAGKCNYIMTSDNFFSTIPDTQVYDIVFIDGLHLKDQVLRDVDNSLKHLSENGTIVMHDCNPLKREHATPKYNGGVWNGTVYIGFLTLRMRDNLCMWTVDKDCGCGIIKRGKQKPLTKQPITFDLLENNRKEVLNLISAEEFVSIF